MRRVIKSGNKAREALASGAQFLADAVSATLGPYGYNWFLEKSRRPTNDGKKIASEIHLPDEIENLGAAGIREAALKTDDEVGDGTTTAITLATEIFRAASKFLGKEGVIGSKTPSEIVRQIESERVEVTQKLVAMATPIDTKEQLIASARVAVEDEIMGNLIGTAQWELGRDGILLAEETAERTSSVERVNGIRIDNGFGTSQIVNNQERQTLEVSDTPTLLTTQTIKTIGDFQAIGVLAQSIFKSGRNQLLVVARAWTDDTVRLCLENINRGSVKIYPISAPYMDTQERMKDLKAVLGGEFYDSENSTLADFKVEGLGFATKVVAKRMDAVLTGRNDIASQLRIQERVAELEQAFEGSKSDFERRGLRERIAQLTNGFAIVHVGSHSDMERKRMYDKCEDAVHAVRAAYAEGTVKGAGLAFKEISDSLPSDYILKIPLLSIYEQIVSSAPKGFVVEEWVRDPVKVLRIALQNACGAAAAFATAGGAIAEKKPGELDDLFKGRIQENG